jgi:hypothetical protein
MADRARFAEIEALREGRELPPADDEQAQLVNAFFALLPTDPEIFRAAMEVVACITPLAQVLMRPSVRERIAAGADQSPMPMPGPTRAELLALLG